MVLSDIVECLRIIEILVTAKQLLDKNSTKLQRLQERVVVFKKILQAYQLNLALVTPRVELMIKELKEVLHDIRGFSESYNRKGIYSKMERVFLRAEKEEDIVDLNQRLNDCVLSFGMVQNMDQELRRVQSDSPPPSSSPNVTNGSSAPASASSLVYTSFPFPTREESTSPSLSPVVQTRVGNNDSGLNCFAASSPSSSSSMAIDMRSPAFQNVQGRDVELQDYNHADNSYDLSMYHRMETRNPLNNASSSSHTHGASYNNNGFSPILVINLEAIHQNGRDSSKGAENEYVSDGGASESLSDDSVKAHSPTISSNRSRGQAKFSIPSVTSSAFRKISSAETFGTDINSSCNFDMKKILRETFASNTDKKGIDYNRLECHEVIGALANTTNAMDANKALKRIDNLTSNSSKESFTKQQLHSNRKIVAACNGCSVVVRIANLYLTFPEVVTFACIVIRNLAHEDDLYTKQEGEEMCHIIIAALKIHGAKSKNKDLTEQACRTLYNLSISSEELVSYIGTQDGCDVVIKILAARVSRDEIRLCKEALWCLCSLSTLPANKVRIGASNGCNIVIDSLQHHKENADVVEAALRTIVNLAIINSNRIQIIAHQGCEVVVAAATRLYSTSIEWDCFLNMHGYGCWSRCDVINSRVSEQACRAIYNLSFNPNATNRLILCKAKEALTFVMKNYPSGPCQTWSKYAMKRLSRRGDGNQVHNEKIRTKNTNEKGNNKGKKNMDDDGEDAHGYDEDQDYNDDDDDGNGNSNEDANRDVFCSLDDSKNKDRKTCFSSIRQDQRGCLYTLCSVCV